MQLLFTIRPAPSAPVSGGSVAIWIWLMVVLAIVVIGGYVLSLRR